MTRTVQIQSHFSSKGFETFSIFAMSAFLGMMNIKRRNIKNKVLSELVNHGIMKITFYC